MLRYLSKTYLLFILLLASRVVGGAAVTNATGTNESTCGLYLAVSSTSTADTTTWGLYTGKDLDEATPVGYPDIAVNILHLKANSAYAGNDQEMQTYLMLIVEFLESLIWVAGPAGAKFELETGRVVSSIPGAGALSAFNSKLTNAAWQGRAPYGRTVMGETPGLNHPGRGAYSPFYNTIVETIMPVKSGSEIFVDYGTSWAADGGEDELTKDEFVKLDETVVKMIAFFEKHAAALDDESAQQVYSFLSKDVMQAAVGAGKAHRIADILPTSYKDLPQIPQAGGSMVYSKPVFQREIEWLDQHGRCMDNIRPGASQILNAGRGAFATRAIAKGTVVAPLPLIHIPDKSILNIHDVAINEQGDYISQSDQIIGQQLVINYCLGHPESTMVFLPTGAVASFINHSDKPNARLEWSTHPAHQKLWLNLDPIELITDEDNMFLGLLMDVVALRDIELGEEVTIDYGPEWQAAWKNHVEQWKAAADKGIISKEWPLKAVDMNTAHLVKPYKTIEELKVKPYPENVVLKAFISYRETEHEGDANDPGIWGTEGDAVVFNSELLRDVEVVARYEMQSRENETDKGELQDSSPISKTMYIIRYEDETDILAHTYLSGVPHEAFVFVDAPETSDQFIFQQHPEQPVFRHWIGIPDDIFPPGPWRNVRASAET